MSARRLWIQVNPFEDFHPYLFLLMGLFPVYTTPVNLIQISFRFNSFGSAEAFTWSLFSLNDPPICLGTEDVWACKDVLPVWARPAVLRCAGGCWRAQREHCPADRLQGWPELCCCCSSVRTDRRLRTPAGAMGNRQHHWGLPTHDWKGVMAGKLKIATDLSFCIVTCIWA